MASYLKISRLAVAALPMCRIYLGRDGQKLQIKSDRSSSIASLGSSYVQSANLGDVRTPGYGFVGVSKLHEVVLTR